MCLIAPFQGAFVSSGSAARLHICLNPLAARIPVIEHREILMQVKITFAAALPAAAVIASLVSVLGSAASPAHAQVAALDFATPGEHTQGSYVLGWFFQTNAPISVSALGYYSDANGMANSHDVGIYDLLNSTFVATTTVLPSDPLIGKFRFHNLAAPIDLVQGRQYAIVGVTYHDHYNSNATGITTDPSLSYQGGAWNSTTAAASSLLAPNQTFNGTNYWPTPNFLIGGSGAPSVAAPEPGTLGLLALGLLRGVRAMMRRKHRRA